MLGLMDIKLKDERKNYRKLVKNREDMRKLLKKECENNNKRYLTTVRKLRKEMQRFKHYVNETFMKKDDNLQMDMHRQPVPPGISDSKASTGYVIWYGWVGHKQICAQVKIVNAGHALIFSELSEVRDPKDFTQACGSMRFHLWYVS